MKQYPGITIAHHTDGSVYYRCSITYCRKHISLGSYTDPALGSQAYEEAGRILNPSSDSANPTDSGTPSVQISDYSSDMALSFSKFVSLVNLRCNGIYIKTPIFLYPDYFLYYLEPELALKFDRDDLFFYSSHTIQQRGGYRFVCHYGSQYGILSRYGIRQFAVAGRDYIFVNGDDRDYRYQNIKVLNHYMGVTTQTKQGKTTYQASIHLQGNYIIGRYATELQAAAAYNKAADILKQKGFPKQFIRNYIPELSSAEYQKLYESVSISERLTSL